MYKLLFFWLSIGVAAAAPVRCFIALKNLSDRLASRNVPDAAPVRSLAAQGILSHRNLVVGAVYWSALAPSPIKITKIDKAHVPPLVEFEYGNFSSPVKVSTEISPARDIFVSANRDDALAIVGKATLAGSITKPENVPRILALAAIRKSVSVGASGKDRPRTARARNGDNPTSLSGRVDAAIVALKAGNVEAVDTFLKSFFDETGINPYKLGAYQSANPVLDRPQGQKGSSAWRQVTSHSFGSFLDDWREIVGMPEGGITPPLDQAMAELSWRAGDETFSSPTRRISLYDYRSQRQQAWRLKDGGAEEAQAQLLGAQAKVTALVERVQKEHPGKEVIFAFVPNTHSKSSQGLREAFQNLDYKVADKGSLEIRNKDETSQKELGRNDRILKYRRLGTSFGMNNAKQFDDKIVIVVDDVETSGVTMDNAIADLYFRGGASAVYGLSFYRVEDNFDASK